MLLFKSLGMEMPISLEQYFPKPTFVEYSFCNEFMIKKSSLQKVLEMLN